MPIKVKCEKYKSLLQSANTVFSVVKQHLINFIPIKYRLKCNFQEPPTIFLFNMKSVSSAMTWALIARRSPDGVPRSRDLNQNFPSVSSLTRKSESFDLRLRLEFSSLLSSLEADHFLGLLY